DRAGRKPGPRQAPDQIPPRRTPVRRSPTVRREEASLLIMCSSPVVREFGSGQLQPGENLVIVWLLVLGRINMGRTNRLRRRRDRLPGLERERDGIVVARENARALGDGDKIGRRVTHFAAT